MIVMKNQYIDKAGIWLAGVFIILQPLMLQNPLDPYFQGFLSKLQIADVFFPLLFIVVAVHLAKELKVGRQLDRTWVFLLFPFLFIVFNFFSGLASDYGMNLSAQLKYVYLISIFFVFLYAQERIFSHKKLLLIYLCLYTTLAYIFISILFYIYAFITGESNIFAHVRSDFPYFNHIVRLIGPMTPTSKTFGAYLLFVSLLFFLNKKNVSKRLWLLGLSAIFICSLLTLGRVGAVTMIFILIGATFAYCKSQWLKTLAILIGIILFILIQVATIWHFDRARIAVNCEQEYSITEKSQYYGWYNSPEMCSAEITANITYSSYYLMKLVAIDAWKLNPILGVGIGHYGEVWLGAAGKTLPDYFYDYVFTLAQSTYFTLLAEVGLLGFFAWFGFMAFAIYYIYKNHRNNQNAVNLIVLWSVCLAYAMIDLDFQNFRFLYYMIPILAMSGEIKNINTLTRTNH